MPKGVSPMVTVSVSEDQLKCLIYLISKEYEAIKLIELTEEEERMYHTVLYSDFYEEVEKEQVWFTVVPEKGEEM